MHGIGVVGISWKQKLPGLLAEFTIPREERVERLPALAEAVGARELVYIATCNRVEITFTTSGAKAVANARRGAFAALAGREPRAGEADHLLKAWHGEGAVEHLFLLTAGLDSARVGESEITGQVRDAVSDSHAAGLLGHRLEHVFTEAVRVAKHVRPMTEGRVGRASLAEIGMRHVWERLDRTAGSVALIGVSAMTEQCARELRSRDVPLLIVNRTLTRAVELAQMVGAEARSLDEFRAAPHPVEVVILATGATEPVLDRADLERIAARVPSGQSPLVVDFCVPAGVTPEAALAADVPRIGMDAITEEAARERQRTLVDFADARLVIDDALTEFRRATADRLMGPMIAQLRLRYRRTALEGVERLFKRELAGVGEHEQMIIRQWAETLARRFAHLPSVGLRELMHEAGPSAVEAFIRDAEPDMARELHAIVEPTDTTGPHHS